MNQTSVVLEVGVLIEHIVEVSDFPVSHGFLVVNWKKIITVEPPEVSLEAHDILNVLLVVRAEQDAGVVLVVDEQLHWRLNKASHTNQIRSVTVEVEPIEKVSLVVVL